MTPDDSSSVVRFGQTARQNKSVKASKGNLAAGPTNCETVAPTFANLKKAVKNP